MQPSCGLANDHEGCENVVLCRGYGDVQQWVVGSGHCCSYLWVGLASGAIECWKQGCAQDWVSLDH